jgi:hypothetical protein
MRDWGRWTSRVAGWLVVGGAVMCGVPAAATARVWTITPTPSPGTSGACLQGVSGDRSGVWAVGGRGLSCDGSTRTLIERRAGGRWSVAPGAPLKASDEAGLHDVLALSPNDAWAVGAVWHGDTGTNQTLMEHWNGDRWTQYPTSGGFRLDSITQVPGTDHLWTVGTSGPKQNLAGYWDGTRWRFTSIPAPTHGIAESNPFGVAAVSETDVWAVGYAPSFSPAYGFSEHWNGQQWSVVPLPKDARGDTGDLQDVANVPHTSQIWAVGWKSRFTAVGDTTLVERYAHGRWQVVPSPRRGQDSRLTSVVALTRDNMWAVGSWYGRKGRQATLIEHYYYGRWHIVPSPSAAPLANELDSIAVVTRHARRVLWAVGARFEGQLRTLAMRGR